MKKIILILLIVFMAFSGSTMPIPNVGKSPPPENTTIISTIFQANPIVVAIVSPSFDIAPALPFIMFGHSELQAMTPDRTSWTGPACGLNNMQACSVVPSIPSRQIHCLNSPAANTQKKERRNYRALCISGSSFLINQA